MLHWTYKKNDGDLEQGDILRKSDYLIDTLKKYHPYYIQKTSNELFIVITQSCDLVMRDGSCKAPYITLAPIRPLRVILEKEFHAYLHNTEPGAQQYGAFYLKRELSEFLKKLFNNNDPKYFFIKEQSDEEIAEDMCAITSLAISIKAEHYDECKKARILQLDDTFQAKLGWLVGQQFSRVGTKDWDVKDLQNKVDEVISSMAVWVQDGLISKLDKAVEDHKNTYGSSIDAITLDKLLKNIPDKKTQAIDAIFTILESEGLLPAGRDPMKFKLRKKIYSDAIFSNFFKEG